MELNLNTDQARVVAEVTRMSGFQLLVKALEVQGDDLLTLVLAADTNEAEQRAVADLRAYARVVNTLKSIKDQVSVENPIDELDPFDQRRAQLQAELALFGNMESGEN